MKGVYKNYVNNRAVRLPLMKPPASYRGLNTPGGIQINSHTATGYKILGNRLTIAAVSGTQPSVPSFLILVTMETTIKAFTAIRVNSELATVKAIVNDTLTYNAADGSASTTNNATVADDICQEHIGCGLNIFGEGAFREARGLALDLTKELAGAKVEVENLETTTASGVVMHRWTIVKML